MPQELTQLQIEVLISGLIAGPNDAYIQTLREIRPDVYGKEYPELLARSAALKEGIRRILPEGYTLSPEEAARLGLFDRADRVALEEYAQEPSDNHVNGIMREAARRYLAQGQSQDS